MRLSITFVNISNFILSNLNFDTIFSQAVHDFNGICLEIFRHQAKNCLPYSQFIQLLKIDPEKINHFSQIPFLPIELFKTHKVYSFIEEPELVFKSSGTTGITTSSHYVAKKEMYEKSVVACFKLFFGDPSDYCILGLLPGYLERGNSSLVYMVNALQQLSGHPSNGFYLHDFDQLNALLKQLEAQKQKTLLFGVTYALQDFAAQYPQSLQSTTIIETGGMKGKRKEITREQLHNELHAAFGDQAKIRSEYGMTELLSQAWLNNGVFYTPPWMRIVLREKNDPFALKAHGSGIINVIDLANLHSCSFIATNDAGRLHSNNGFEVLGRVDHQDIRGCNLLYE